MLRRLSPLILVLGIMVLFALQTAFFYPHLPDRMASHFGPNGQPDGWMPKGVFVVTYGIFLLFLHVLITSTSLLFRLISPELINLPDKEYWLAPERRGQTLGKLESAMTSLAMATSTLLIFIVQDVYKANLKDGPHLGLTPWILLALYCVFMIVWTVALVGRFQKPNG